MIEEDYAPNVCEIGYVILDEWVSACIFRDSMVTCGLNFWFEIELMVGNGSLVARILLVLNWT